MKPSINPPTPLNFPTEIATEVFKQVISIEFEALYDDTTPVGLTSPLILSSVCCSWRTFVQNVPTLWRVIVLKLSKNRYKSQLFILKIWLENSGALPLQIWFDADERLFRFSQDRDVEPVYAALRQIVDHSDRWETINLCVTEDYNYINVLRKIKGRIPILRAGHLRTFDRGSFPFTNLDMFEGAPLLNSFAISTLRVKNITLPWMQLTSICARVNTTECFTILSRCANLEEGTLYATMENRHILPTVDSRIFINMPRLRSLSITNHDGNTVELLLPRITCPALRHLRLSNGDTPLERLMDLPFSKIEGLITRSNCDIEMLYLKSYSVPLQGDVFRILERTPCLQELSIQTQKAYTRGNIFDALIERLDSSAYPSFLPNLKCIRYITPIPIDNAIYNRLGTILEQRQGPSDGLVIDLVVASLYPRIIESRYDSCEPSRVGSPVSSPVGSPVGSPELYD